MARSEDEEAYWEQINKERRDRVEFVTQAINAGFTESQARFLADHGLKVQQ